jgi:hypothetical protein
MSLPREADAALERQLTVEHDQESHEVADRRGQPHAKESPVQEEDIVEVAGNIDDQLAADGNHAIL